MNCDGCLHLESERDGAIKNAKEAEAEVAKLKLQNDELRQAIADVRDIMSGNGDKKDLAYRDWYDKTRVMENRKDELPLELRVNDRQHLLERCYLELYGSMNDEREYKREDCLKAARAIAKRIAEIDERKASE